jgi:DNA-directed RNA polymerase I subunit RPA12
MDVPESDHVKCIYCPFSCNFADLNIPEVTIKSKPTVKPTWIADGDTDGLKGSSATSGQKDMVKHATIAEPCPKCGNPEMFFYTMQLRSVDEGSTVFYECPIVRCGNKFSVNN